MTSKNSSGIDIHQHFISYANKLPVLPVFVVKNNAVSIIKM